MDGFHLGLDGVYHPFAREKLNSTAFPSRFLNGNGFGCHVHPLSFNGNGFHGGRHLSGGLFRLRWKDIDGFHC